MTTIDALGFQKPTSIQEQALPILLGEPTDFIGLAATGTGKTAAFSIPLIEKLDPTVKAVQALILCPTRELALQVSGQIDLLGKKKNIRALPIYGGSNYKDQLNGLKRGVSVVVGTPGRVVDHILRGTLVLDKLTTLILDEADEMISMGFKDDMDVILGKAPKEQSKTWLFSATMSGDVRKVADRHLKNPKFVQVNRSEVLSTTVEQIFYACRDSNKPDILCKIIEAAHDFYGIVFCQTKLLVVDLTRYLSEQGYKVDNLHGDKDQRSREQTTQAFRDRRVKILICTDVAARGLDISDVTHVINYSIPRELESYVHRIGRTARGGKKGVAISLVTPSHRHLIMRLEKMTKSKIKEGVLPTRKDIGTKKVKKILSEFNGQVNFGRAQELLDPDWISSLAGMTVEEVAARFISMSFPSLFEDKEREKHNLGQPRDLGGRQHSGHRHQSGDRPPRREDRRDQRPHSFGSKHKKRFDHPKKHFGPKRDHR